jgi:hypothetical protein
MAQFDWQRLERELRDGATLATVCVKLGLSLDEAKAYLMEMEAWRAMADGVDIISAENARVIAMQTLSELAVADEDGQVRCQAARALLQHYRDEKNRLEKRRKEGGDDAPLGQRNLFGPWDLRAPGL